MQQHLVWGSVEIGPSPLIKPCMTAAEALTILGLKLHGGSRSFESFDEVFVTKATEACSVSHEASKSQDPVTRQMKTTTQLKLAADAEV